MDYFLECVDNEYYVIPNKVVPKRDRSSWRFKAKRYYKELNSILSNNENGDEATILLIELFKRLSVGSNRLLFTNWETFRALGISQSEYYDVIVKRILYHGYTKENLTRCIKLLDTLKEPYELFYSMFWIFISNLRTTYNKQMSIEILDSRLNELKITLKDFRDYRVEFAITESINDYVECITEIYIGLCEIDSGIKYFNNNYIEKQKEIKEYVLLHKLEELNLKEAWLEEYEKKCK